MYIEITSAESKKIRERVLEPLTLEKWQGLIENIYWHIVNNFYDTSIVLSMVERDITEDHSEAEKIVSTLFEIANTEHKNQNAKSIQHDTVAPMRTMANDMEKVHGYGVLASTDTDDTEEESVYKTEQEAVLTKPKVATTPTYTPDPVPVDTDKPETNATETTATPDTRWHSSVRDDD